MAQTALTIDLLNLRETRELYDAAVAIYAQITREGQIRSWEISVAKLGEALENVSKKRPTSDND